MVPRRDNGPYVLHGTYQVGTIAAKGEAWAHVPVSFPDGNYGVSAHCCSAVPYWTHVSLMVDDFRPTQFSLRWCNDADVAVSGFVVTWLAVWAP